MIGRTLVSTLLPLSAFGLLTTAAAAQGGFVERAQAAGLDHRFMSGLDRIGDLPAMHDWVQQGIAVADADGDSDLDVVVLGRLAPNHAFRNLGGGQFQDATSYAKIASSEFDTCCAFADYDNDGDMDLVIGVYEHGSYALRGWTRLYANDGTGRFEDVTTLAGELGSGHTLFAKWFDADLDGWSDLHLAEFCATNNLLYRNNTDGSFTDLSAGLGTDTGGSTHVVSTLDADGDGFVDILVGNDFMVTASAGLTPNLGEKVLMGQADGTWSDFTTGSGMDDQATTMGMTVGDVNYDGLPDVFKTEMGPQFLMINNGWPGSGTAWTHEEVAYGVDLPLVPDPQNPGQFGDTVGWGCALIDVDFDTWLDLFVVAGHVHPLGTRFQRNFLMRGDGPATGFGFTDFTTQYGLYEEIDERSLSVADLDHDGDLDLLIGPPGGNLRYYENQIDPLGQGWLAVVPVCNTSSRDATGVKVSWTDSLGYPHLRWLGAEAPTASQNENRAYFGMGSEPSADVTVEFPSGITLSFPATAPNTEITAVEPELIRLSQSKVPAVTTGKTTVGTAIGAGLGRRGARVVVTAFAHDASGTPLGASANVTIDVPGLGPLGPVQHVSGNEFRRAFAAVGVPGEHRAEVSFDGFQVKVRPRITLVGPADAAATTARLFPEALRAATSDQFKIEVAPKDAAGVLLGPGRDVQVTVPGLLPLKALTDLGDGRYSGTFPGPPAPGLSTFDLMVDGVLLTNVTQGESGGPASPTLSELYFESPPTEPAMNPNLYQVLVRPKDDLGLRLGPFADVEITVHPDVGTETVTVRTDLGPNAQVDGDHYFVLERPAGSAAGSAKGSYDVFVDGVLINTVAYDF